MNSLHVVLGTGPLGRAVAEALLQGNHEVRLVNRSGEMPESPSGAHVLATNLYDASAVRAVTEGAAVVYQCAQPHYHEWPEKFPPLQAAILDGLAGSDARLVIGENTYMYADADGAPLTEASIVGPHTRKGKVRAALHETALAAHQAGKVKVTFGRGSDFFGPWALDSSHGSRVFRAALAGKSANFFARLDQPHTATYIRDFGAALVVLGAHEQALGQAWHVPNDRPTVTQGEFGNLIYEQLGTAPKLSTTSKAMMRMAGLFMPGAREMVEMSYEFEKPFVIDSSKFERTFGMRPTPLPQAIQETLDWYRSHPQ
jgi:nucleoside-diphosphate-sugar epimerase